MYRSLRFIVLGISVSVVGNSLITILPSFNNADFDAILYWLPFQFVIGAGIGLISSHTGSSWQLVAAGSIYAWMPGALATILVGNVLNLSAEQRNTTLYTVGVLVGTVSGLFPYWITRWTQRIEIACKNRKSKQ